MGAPAYLSESKSPPLQKASMCENITGGKVRMLSSSIVRSVELWIAAYSWSCLALEATLELLHCVLRVLLLPVNQAVMQPVKPWPVPSGAQVQMKWQLFSAANPGLFSIRSTRHFLELYSMHRTAEHY
jgi:hypothetical protein